MSILTDLFKRSKSEVVVLDDKQTKQIYTDILKQSIIYTNEMFNSISVIHTCCKILSSDLARMPIKIYKLDEKGNKVLLKDDPRYRLLHDRPNSYLNAFKFWNHAEFNRNWTGNTYIHIIRDLNGFPVSLEKIDNDKVIGHTKVNGDLFYNIKDKNRQKITLPAIDILHFSDSYGDDEVDGADPRKILKYNVAVLYKAFTTLHNTYDKGLITNLYLKTVLPDIGNGNINATQWMTAINEFIKNNQGYDNAMEPKRIPMFTEPMAVPVNLVDAELINTMKAMTIQIAAFYRIPTYLVGIIENTKFNSLQELSLNYVRDTLGPNKAMYESELEFKLLTESELAAGYSIELEDKALMETDLKTRVDTYLKERDLGIITPNQICKYENLPQFEGGDKHFMSNQLKTVEAYALDITKQQQSNK
jgi:HK97 family phage portal protein